MVGPDETGNILCLQRDVYRGLLYACVLWLKLDPAPPGPQGGAFGTGPLANDLHGIIVAEVAYGLSISPHPGSP